MALADLLDAIDTRIAAVLSADPTEWFDYRIGDKTVTKSEYLKWLYSSRKELLLMPPDAPDVAFMQFDFNVDATTGEDDTEFIS